MSRGEAVLASPPARRVGTSDDHELVAATRRGDDSAFEALYERYRGRITGYVQGMVKDHGRAEDVTQEVFMSALRRMRETERPIAFKPWVYEIARNACIDQFRRSRRAEEVSYDARDGLPGADGLRLVSTDPAPDDAFHAKERLDHLRGAFGGLNEAHHRILVLRELEGLSYREIGEQMGLSRSAVESTLFRARRRLSEEYDELVTGRRCVRVQTILAEAGEGMLGVRDRRRLARHLSYCQPCRRHARHLGVETLGARRGVAVRLAALMPLPAFLRRGAHAHWTASAAAAGEPLAANWAKAAVAVAALAVAGVGAGIVTQHRPAGAGSQGGVETGRVASVAVPAAPAAGPDASAWTSSAARTLGVTFIGPSLAPADRHALPGAGAPATRRPARPGTPSEPSASTGTVVPGVPVSGLPSGVGSGVVLPHVTLPVPPLPDAKVPSVVPPGTVSGVTGHLATPPATPPPSTAHSTPATAPAQASPSATTGTAPRPPAGSLSPAGG